MSAFTARAERDTPSPSQPRGAGCMPSSPTVCSLYQRLLMAAPEQLRAKDSRAENTLPLASTLRLRVFSPGSWDPLYFLHSTCFFQSSLCADPQSLSPYPVPVPAALSPTADLQTPGMWISLNLGQHRLAVCVHTRVSM